MKKTLAMLVMGSALSFQAMSQDYAKTEIIPVAPKTYLGFGTGLNNYVGLIGPNIEHQLADKFTVFAGAGLGSWGYKLSGGIRYYANFPGRWAFGLGFSQATGIEKIDMDMPAEFVIGQSSQVKVPMKLKPANTVNLSAMRYWMIGRRQVNRFNIELGYAVAIADNQHEVKNSYVLTEQGKAFMNFMQPGGLIIGAGLSFAL